MAPGSPISLPALLDALEERWDALGPTGVRQRLVEYAGAVRPERRGDLLAVFEPAAGNGEPSVTTRSSELLARIDEFAARVTARDERHRAPNGWSTGDGPSPGAGGDRAVIEGDTLARLVGDAFLAGDREVAAEGFERLLDLEAGRGPAASRVVSPDLLDEALARLLWLDAGDPTRPPVPRATRVVEHHDRYVHVAKSPAAGAVLLAHTDPLDARVLSVVAHRLATAPRPVPWIRRAELAAALAYEAGGSARVLELARHDKAVEPVGLYRWLAEHERRHGSPADAARWAEEGLLGHDSPELARLADLAADVRRSLGRREDFRLAREASTRAWRAQPTAWRLAWALADAGVDPEDAPARSWSALLNRLRLGRSGHAGRPDDGGSVPAAVDVAFAALEGDVRAIADRAAPGSEAVLDGLAAERLALAVLCAAGAGVDLPRLEGVVAGALDGAPPAGPAGGPLPDPPRPLASWVMGALRRLTADATWLDAAVVLTEQSYGLASRTRQSRDLAEPISAMVMLLAEAHSAVWPGAGDMILLRFLDLQS